MICSVLNVFDIIWSYRQLCFVLTVSYTVTKIWYGTNRTATLLHMLLVHG